MTEDTRRFKSTWEIRSAEDWWDGAFSSKLPGDHLTHKAK